MATRKRLGAPVLTADQRRKLSTWAYSRILLENERVRVKRRVDALTAQLDELGDYQTIGRRLGVSPEHAKSVHSTLREQLKVDGGVS